MDATLLRVILLILGLAFLAGIYFYETARRKRDSAQARRRMAPKVEPTFESVEASAPSATEDTVEDAGAYDDEYEDEYEDDEETQLLDEDESRVSAFEEEPEPLVSLRIDDEPIENLDTPAVSAPGRSAKPPTGVGQRTKAPAMEQQDLFAFSAQEESPVDVPDLILQINLRAKKTPFTGEAIKQAMHETGMQLSDMAIYQRLASDGSRSVLYNIASMVNPGVFPVKSMESFSTPGLTLFAQLPGPVDGMMIFSDMLYTAERLAAMLQGELQDETHSTLGKQTIEHMRERILEHKRQIQLARRKG